MCWNVHHTEKTKLEVKISNGESLVSNSGANPSAVPETVSSDVRRRQNSILSMLTYAKGA